ncbi:hypothetical protein BGZ76_002623 [Entomortierella beljakovae]|nr:hypothetical protein BGZ76_002623 [Entomortierella beljakovae]
MQNSVPGSSENWLSVPGANNEYSNSNGSTSISPNLAAGVRKWFIKETRDMYQVSRFQCTDKFQYATKLKISEKNFTFSVRMEDLTSIEYELCDVVLELSANQQLAASIKSITLNLNLIEAGEMDSTIAQWFTMAKSDDSTAWQLHQSYSVKRQAGQFRMEIVINAGDISDDSTMDLFSIRWSRMEQLNQAMIPKGTIWDSSQNPWLRVPRRYRKNVLCYSISQDEGYAATLCKETHGVTLELWVLPEIGSIINDNQHLQRRLYIPFTGFTEDNFARLYISISWLGNQISMVDSMAGSPLLEEGTKKLEFRVYTWRGVNDSNSFVVSKCLKNIDDVGNIGGLGKFHIPSSDGKPDPKEEIFILCKCRGNSVDIYNVHGRWSLIRSISLGESINGDNKFQGIESMGIVTGVQGRFFPRIYHSGNIVSLWDIKTGAMASYVMIQNAGRDDIPICISCDGNILAIVDGHIIRTYRTSTGSLLGSYEMPCDAIDSITFVHNDTQIVAFTDGNNSTQNAFRYGCVLETASMSVSYWIHCAGTIIRHPTANAKGYLCFVQDTNLYFSKIESFAVQEENSFYLPKQHNTNLPCSRSRCEEHLQPITRNTSIKFNTPSGLKFSANIALRTSIPTQSTQKATTKIPLFSHRKSPLTSKKNEQDKTPHLIVSGNSAHELVIPPIYKSQKSLDAYKNIAFLGIHSNLIIISDSTIMIWKVPDRTGDKFILQLAWTFDDSTILDDDFKICKHQQPRCISKKKTYVPSLDRIIGRTSLYEPLELEDTTSYHRVHYPRVSRVAYMEYKSEFRSGILTLSKMFKIADDIFKDSVLEYFGRNINNQCLLELFSQDLSSEWEPFVEVASAYLHSPSTKWVPPVKLNPKLNPILEAVETSAKTPEKIEAVENMIDQFIKQGKYEKDPHIVMMVTQCLASLNSGANSHTNLMKRTLRRLAYFPVKSQQFVLNNYTVATPPRFNWRHIFWREKMKINVSQDPILQLSFSSEVRRAQYVGHFVAIIILLFLATIITIFFPLILLFDDTDPWQENVEVLLKVWFFLFMAFLSPVVAALTAIALSVTYVFSKVFRMPTANHNVMKFAKAYHSTLLDISSLLFIFNPEEEKELDRPFIRDLYVATFEMLWTNFGRESFDPLPVAPAEFTSPPSTYWIKFSFHLFLYKLNPLTHATVKCHNFSIDMLDNPAIRALVEYKCNQDFLVWIFRAIIVFSGIFLYLEVEQFFWNKSRYVRSIYNYVDLLTFISALIGSFDQLQRNEDERGNPGILSFTVIFAALQFMFELRINRGVSILHLLKSKPGGVDSKDDSEFPENYYSAVTTTFFFTAGRYDSISDLFNKGTDEGNWMFLTMMILSFTFSGIIILNVLIALINVAFSEGDETWQQVWLENRMYIVEAAENMTYHIPDYRKYYASSFPREIYYSAQDRETKSKYEKETNNLIKEANAYLTEWLESIKPSYKRPLESMEDNPSETIQELRDKNAKLETTLDEMQTDINGLQKNIKGLTHNMNSLQKDMSGLKSDMSGIQSQLSLILEKMSKV